MNYENKKKVLESIADSLLDIAFNSIIMGFGCIHIFILTYLLKNVDEIYCAVLYMHDMQEFRRLKKL